MKLTEQQLKEMGYVESKVGEWQRLGPSLSVCQAPPDRRQQAMNEPPKPPKRIRQSSKPLMNVTEQRCLDLLESRGIVGILKQAITIRLDHPFKSYRPDLAYMLEDWLVFVEVKGMHRFRRAGIAKAALAAKTYPQFRFELFEWDGNSWKETRL